MNPQSNSSNYNSIVTQIHSYLGKQILSFNEAIQYLDVSKSFLYKLTSQNLISYSKPSGKLIYFKKSDLDNWMLQNTATSVLHEENEMFNYLNR